MLAEMGVPVPQLALTTGIRAERSCSGVPVISQEPRRPARRSHMQHVEATLIQLHVTRERYARATGTSFINLAKLHNEQL